MTLLVEATLRDEWTPVRRARSLFARLDLPISPSDRLAYGPFLVQLVVTRACNLQCGYCNEYERTARPVPLDVLKERVYAIHRLGALALEMTGGEPLLHPGLVEIVRYATALGFPARMLITNAVLMTPDTIDRLNDAGLTALQVSVDGVAPNEVTVKVLQRLEPKLVMLARRARFKIVVSGVVGASPPGEVLDVIEFTKGLGLTPRVLLVHDGSGRFGLGPENVDAFHAAAARLGRRFRESHGYRERLLRGQPAPFKCRAGARYLYVDERGLVHWCSQQQERFAKPIAEYTVEDLKANFRVAKACNAFCTVGCARTTSAYDEWRSQRQP